MSNFKCKFFIIFSILLAPHCWSARILAIMPVNLYTHQSNYYPLWRNLSQRGHEVVVYTTHPMNDPSLTNLTEINIKTEQDLNVLELMEKSSESFEDMRKLINWYIYDFPVSVLEHESIKALINEKSEKFDVMLVESTMFYLYGFAKLFDCPIISVSAVTCHPKVYERVGNNEAGVILENSHPNSEKTLFSRIIDALSYFIKYYFEHAEYKQTNVVLQKYFGNDYNLNELMERVSMVFENTDNVLYPVRPMIPTVVQIGGINLFNEVPDLPKSLERTLDAASQGFIYLSLGTVLSDSDRIPTKVFLEVFKNLPYTVLWKHNNDLKDLPENVHVSNWFPQRNVLKHKNIKLFLMQGGANSLLEAIHCEVPLIAMPFFFDQFRNSRLIEHYGVGARLNFTKLNAKVFEEKIIEVAENPRYKQNIIKLKKLIDDEPLSGLDKAVFWTEYVIRHNGTKHLRSPVLDIPFYQYYLLDVIGVFVVVFILVLYVSILILKMIRAVLCSMLQKKLKTN